MYNIQLTSRLIPALGPQHRCCNVEFPIFKNKPFVSVSSKIDTFCMNANNIGE